MQYNITLLYIQGCYNGIAWDYSGNTNASGPSLLCCTWRNWCEWVGLRQHGVAISKCKPYSSMDISQMVQYEVQYTTLQGWYRISYGAVRVHWCTMYNGAAYPWLAVPIHCMISIIYVCVCPTTKKPILPWERQSDQIILWEYLAFQFSYGFHKARWLLQYWEQLAQLRPSKH